MSLSPWPLATSAVVMPTPDKAVVHLFEEQTSGLFDHG